MTRKLLAILLHFTSFYLILLHFTTFYFYYILLHFTSFRKKHGVYKKFGYPFSPFSLFKTTPLKLRHWKRHPVSGISRIQILLLFRIKKYYMDSFKFQVLLYSCKLTPLWGIVFIYIQEYLIKWKYLYTKIIIKMINLITQRQDMHENLGYEPALSYLMTSSQYAWDSLVKSF